MDVFRGAVHVRADLQLGAEFVAHGLKQGIVANFDEVVGHFQRSEHQPVFVQADGVLPVLLHEPVGGHVPGVAVVIVHHGGMAGQVPDHILAGLFGVSHVDDEFFLPNLLPG